MNIFLGNIQFSEVEEMLGYKLNEEDAKLWDAYHSDMANLSDKETCFHVFQIPLSIKVKGLPAMDAVKKMFTPDKLTNPVGKIQVIPVQ